LSQEARDAILYGTGDKDVRFAYADGSRAYEVKSPSRASSATCSGAIWKPKANGREEISRYMSASPCTPASLSASKPEALAVKIDHKHIGEIIRTVVRDAALWFKMLPEKLDAKRNEIAARILREIDDRLKFLVDVGLDYSRWRAVRGRSRAARASASASPRRSAPA